LDLTIKTEQFYSKSASSVNLFWKELNVNPYLTIQQVTELVPGITKAGLAQRRFQGLPPVYLKPTPKKVLYRREDILAWVESTERTGTAEVAA
jgi:hypothetical protein